jgi:hypothetical protein
MNNNNNDNNDNNGIEIVLRELLRLQQMNEATNEGIGQLRKEISILNNKINTLTAHTLPTLQDGYHEIPVIDAGTVDSCSLEGKHSTWTWFNYGSAGTVIVGAAHCALPFYLPGQPNDLFIQLPVSILQLGVKEVYLVDPYDQSFAKPLPVEKDLIVVRVRNLIGNRKGKTFDGEASRINAMRSRCWIMIQSWVLVSANLRKTAEEKPMKRQSIDKDQVEPNEKEGMHSITWSLVPI